MNFDRHNEEFWANLKSMVDESDIVIDRPKGTCHAKYPDFIYPVDYGYLKNTSSMDGQGIDIWVGSESAEEVNGIICTIDLVKRDSEIKILLSCAEEEISAIYRAMNEKSMSGILIQRQERV